MNLLETLIHPDKEERTERAEVASAANLLQVGEFQILQLAYKEWYGRELPEALVDNLFSAYMFRNEVPFWARQYARNIMRLDDQGGLDDTNPSYHRYDSDFRPRAAPDGVFRFCMAVGFVVLCIGGGIMIAETSTGNGTSVFPPYFDRDEFRSGPRISASDNTQSTSIGQ